MIKTSDNCVFSKADLRAISTKMGADISAENTPNAPKIYLPNLSAQAQKFA